MKNISAYQTKLNESIFNFSHPSKIILKMSDGISVLIKTQIEMRFGPCKLLLIHNFQNQSQTQSIHLFGCGCVAGHCVGNFIMNIYGTASCTSSLECKAHQLYRYQIKYAKSNETNIQTRTYNHRRWPHKMHLWTVYYKILNGLQFKLNIAAGNMHNHLLLGVFYVRAYVDR